jgi:hypothetical protein
MCCYAMHSRISCRAFCCLWQQEINLAQQHVGQLQNFRKNLQLSNGQLQHGRMYVLLPMAAGFKNRPLLLHSSVLLQMQQEINFVLQHCKQCWIIIMDHFEILLCKAQQHVHSYYPALLAMLKSVLLCETQQVLTKVLQQSNMLLCHAQQDIQIYLNMQRENTIFKTCCHWQQLEHSSGVLIDFVICRIFFKNILHITKSYLLLIFSRYYGNIANKTG